MPGAEPFHADGGSTGVLLSHGLSGSPASMRPWGEYLAERGYTVEVPRLPGHGTSVAECNRTRWDDWYATIERSYRLLSERCDHVFVGGLSMGGALAVHLAQRNPEVAGLMLVNPALGSGDPRVKFLLPIMQRLGIREYPAISNDIAKEGMDEVAYDKTPVTALGSFVEHWPMLARDLHRVTQPTILFHAPGDNLVDAVTSQLLKRDIGTNDFTYVELSDSHHVATLDHDAPKIFDRSAAFIERVSADLDSPQKSAS
jgi:carboxylesterase